MRGAIIEASDHSETSGFRGARARKGARPADDIRTVLRGIVWDHPRGYQPLIAASRAFSRPDRVVRIEWDRRPLSAFEDQPLAELTARYDLLVIDHPHIGDAARGNLLEPLERTSIHTHLAEIAAGSLGPSYASYCIDGLTWALPIDASCQVSAWRPDLLERPPTTWTEVIALAEAGSVEVPLKEPHSLLCLLTIAAGHGAIASQCETLLRPGPGAEAFDVLRELTSKLDSGCFGLDPIDALEGLAAGRSRYLPLVFGYCSYARVGFRAERVRFGDIPTIGPNAAAGSVLGGTGIAVSAKSTCKELAAEFACYAASESCQRELWAISGGQPAHRAAWLDPAVADATGDYTSATMRTVELAYVRPRHAGFRSFQQAGARLVNHLLGTGVGAATAVAQLNELYAENLSESETS